MEELDSELVEAGRSLGAQGIGLEVRRYDTREMSVHLSAPLQPAVWVDASCNLITGEPRPIAINCGTTGEGSIDKARGLVRLLEAAIEVGEILDRIRST